MISNRLGSIIRLSDAGPFRMHLSSILVVTDPAAIERCASDLESLAGIEVHYLYPDSGRIIAVQETATARDQEAGLRRIQELESVWMAALIEHRVEPDSRDKQEPQSEVGEP
jgi:nitrate reductase NapAB chaperone NapD